MRRMIGFGLAAVLLAGAASAKDRTGYEAINAGDMARAERTLATERRIFPGRPELMLNLAAVYARTGRMIEANALYREALARPDVPLELPDGSVASSRMLARSGIARIAAPAMASR